MIFDTHAHYDDSAFDEDRDTLLHELHESGAVDKIVNIGASMRGCHDTVKLAGQYDFIFGAIGVHPEDISQVDETFMKQLIAWSSNEKIVAIGEIGLDYHYDEPAPALQKHWFARQIALAREVKLPIVVHSRDAAKDTIDIMQAEKASELGGVIHCYSYSKETARTFLDMGFYFGIGGVLTFKNGRKLKEAVTYLPLDRLVVETDCPYLAPVPFRGKRNQSDYISYVLNALAELKGISREEAERITYENGHRLYGIPLPSPSTHIQ